MFNEFVHYRWYFARFTIFCTDLLNFSGFKVTCSTDVLGFSAISNKILKEFSSLVHVLERFNLGRFIMIKYFKCFC
jgi:hypothetical protein